MFPAKHSVSPGKHGHTLTTLFISFEEWRPCTSTHKGVCAVFVWGCNRHKHPSVSDHHSVLMVESWRYRDRTPSCNRGKLGQTRCPLSLNVAPFRCLRQLSRKYVRSLVQRTTSKHLTSSPTWPAKVRASTTRASSLDHVGHTDTAPVAPPDAAAAAAVEAACDMQERSASHVPALPHQGQIWNKRRVAGVTNTLCES